MHSTDDKLKFETLCDLNKDLSSNEYIFIQLSLDTEQTNGSLYLFFAELFCCSINKQSFI